MSIVLGAGRGGVASRFVQLACLSFVAALGASPACLTRVARPSKPVVEFPSAQSLAAIEGRPVELPAITAGEVPAEGWQVEPPAAPAAGATLDQPWQPQGSWELAFAAEAGAARADLRLTRAMSCVARQVGLFHLKTGADPPELLQEFLIAACGSYVPQVGYQWYGGEVPKSVSDDDLLARWRSHVKGDLVAPLPATATEAGFWYGRAHGVVISVVCYASPRARMAALPLVPDAQGNVTLEGELSAPAEYIVGYANQGRFGVQHCTLDPGVARPRFRAVCHIADGDTAAWVQLLAAPPRRVLASPFAQVLVRRALDQPMPFDMTPYAGSHVVGTAGDLSAAIVAGLNAVRAQAGLSPVRLSIEQSTSAARLAGHFFAAELAPKNDGEESDRIALGLLAGWRMTGMIRDGHFFSSVAPRTRDAGQWLTGALALPLGRATLLAPDVEEVALGPALLPAPGGLAAVVTGYRFYHGDDHAADVGRLYDRILTARQRLGLKMPARLGGMDRVLQQQLARVQAGQLEPSSALQAALDSGVNRFGAGMRGIVFETTSLEAIEIPDEIIKRRDLQLEIAVSHHKPPGAAWAQMVILVVYADSGALMREI